jgi:hypothetical protein
MTNRGPWFISEVAAEARDREVVADFEADVRRCLTTEMPDEVALAKLAALGYHGRLLKTLGRLVESRNG